MKLKAKDINLDSNFWHYSERDRLACERLQAQARELLSQDAAKYENRHPDVLLNAAAGALGPDGEKWLDSGICVCETCGRLFHGDYSTNSDPRHDYCGGSCQPDRSHRRHDE